MAILTTAQLKEHVNTTLPDAALQRLLDDAEADITVWAGPIGNVTEFFRGQVSSLPLSRPASAIVSIRQDIDRTPLTLAANDYRLDGYVLTRLFNGTNPSTYFGYGTVEVVYTPVADTARRQRAQVDLVKLELAYSGLDNAAIEGWSQGFGATSIADRRAEILSTLREPAMRVVGG